MNINRRSFLLISILISVVLIVDGATLFILYKTTVKQEHEHLSVMASSYARLIDSVARYDQRVNKDAPPDVAEKATLSKIQDYQQNFEGFGETGEYLLAKRVGDKVKFLTVTRLQKFLDNENIVVDGKIVLPVGSTLAGPMQQALLGGSGKIIAYDYRGEVVLAGYEIIPSLNYGVVTKMNLNEIQAPFFEAAWISLLVAAILISLGGYLFLRINNAAIRELEESKFYNRTLFDSSPIGLALCAMDGTLLDINPVYAEIIGRGVEETKRLTYWDITPKEYAEQENIQIERLTNTGRYGPYEKEYIHKNGYRVPVSLTGRVVEIGGEKLIWSSVEDITIRRGIIEQLKSATALNEKIIKSSPIGISIYDSSGQCIEANNAIASMVGATRDALLEQNYNTIESWKSIGLFEMAKETIRSQKVGCIESQVTTSFGKEAYLEFQTNTFTIENEVHLLLTTEDISARKESEVALKRSEETLIRAQSIAKLGNWDWDILTGELLWSDEIFRIFGLAPHQFEATYEAFLEHVHPDDRNTVTSAVDASVKDGRPYELEHRVVQPSGEERNVREQGVVYYDDEGKPVRMIGIIQDITESKKAESELLEYRYNLEQLVIERTEDLKSAQNELVRKERLATLGQLTASISHELRNPLSAMSPSLYIIEKLCAEKSDEVKHAIERLSRSIWRCDHIIDELLDFTRITNTNKDDIKVDGWLESIIEEQRVPVGITVTRDFQLGDTSCSIDPNRLRRAVINVFENGCQALIDESTKERFNNAQLTISTHASERGVEMVFEDNGNGISEKHLSKIFEPLFSTKAYGVGLGMPIIKQIMEQHDGGIDITSEENRGTLVTLWIPCSS
jgi:PAS domain S-box-containing protein